MEVWVEFFKWSLIINIGLLIYITIMLIFARDWVFKIHSKMFRLDEKSFSGIIYSFLGLYKLLIIFFNLIPYIVLLIISG